MILVLIVCSVFYIYKKSPKFIVLVEFNRASISLLNPIGYFVSCPKNVIICVRDRKRPDILKTELNRTEPSVSKFSRTEPNPN